MATVTIRLDDNAREELEEMARTRGVTLSVLLCDQIDALLGRDVPMPDDVGQPKAQQVWEYLSGLASVREPAAGGR
jgi:hypothetical protein